MVLKIKEREEAIQLLAMDPQVYGKLLTHHRKGNKVDEEALRDRFPSGRVPEKASGWDHRRTEACGGGKVFSSVFWYTGNILEFIALELGQEVPRGAHKPGGALTPKARPLNLPLPRGSSGLLSKLPGSLLVQKKLIQSFFFVWTPFDNDFLKRQKQAMGTRLIGQSQKMIYNCI